MRKWYRVDLLKLAFIHFCLTSISVGFNIGQRQHLYADGIVSANAWPIDRSRAHRFDHFEYIAPEVCHRGCLKSALLKCYKGKSPKKRHLIREPIFAPKSKKISFVFFVAKCCKRASRATNPGSLCKCGNAFYSYCTYNHVHYFLSLLVINIHKPIATVFVSLERDVSDDFARKIRVPALKLVAY